jgi:phage terminase large subunit-like protein
MSTDAPIQGTLQDVGPLAEVQTFKRTANRQKSIGIITKAPWETWKGSKVGRYIRFVESYLMAPVVRRPMVLHTYQREMYEAWLDPSVRSAMEKIARGNAKTTTAGAFATAHLFLEQDADVPIVATTVKQAEKTVYGCVIDMIEHSPELAGRAQKFTSVADKRIEIPQTNGRIYPMADLVGQLQGLNPSLAVLDEASEAETATWEALRLAGGKRSESLTLGISTPSFRIDGNAMLDTEMALKQGATVPGFVFREHVAPEGCDHKDESVWPLANPGLLTTPPILFIDALRTDVVLTPEQFFRCYRLAQWPTMILQGWLGEDGPELWGSLADDYEFVERRRVFVGVDVSLRHDSSAVVAVQERGNGTWHAKAWIFFPDPSTGRRVVDQAEVRDKIRELDFRYGIAGCAYDPRFFEASAQDLEADGVEMIEVPQTATRMVPAVNMAYRAITSRSLSHDGSDAFARQVVNAAARPSEGGMTLSKNPRTNLKCDAAIALCLAMSLAEFQERELTEDMLKVL